MFSTTISGNTAEELYENLEKAAMAHKSRVALADAPPTYPQQQQQQYPQQQQPAPGAANSSSWNPNPYAGTLTSGTLQPAQPPIAPKIPQQQVAPTANTYTMNTIAQPPGTTMTNPVFGIPQGTPTYTHEAISNAGATLAQMGKDKEVQAILNRYGGGRTVDINPNQYGAVAAELRALGAQI